NFFVPSFPCLRFVQHIGVLRDGSKWVYGMECIAKQEKSVILSVLGINCKSSSGAALVERARGCGVWDTPFGPEIENMPNLMEHAHFFSCALGGRNAHGPDDSPKHYTLDALTTLITSNGLISCENPGHTFLGVLNIDVEGAEFDTLTSFLAHKLLNPFLSTTLPIGQLQIELHA
ncbi:hypothetical protein EDB83DRAFT_2213220, partial [Lactarius deliciosus]